MTATFLRGLTSAEHEILAQIETGEISLSSDRARQLAAAHPDVQVYLQALRAASRSMWEAPVGDQTAFLAEVERQVQETPSRVQSSHAAAGRASQWRRYGWRVSAAVAAVAVIGIAVWQRSAPHHSPSGFPVLERQYATSVGQRSRVDLPDGSHVILAPATQLRFTMDRAGVRTVQLQGEAYFVVTHDSKHLFTVRTGSVATTVLGTAFNVRQYDADAPAEVAVIEGKVSASGERMRDGAAVILTQGMIGRVTDSTAALAQIPLGTPPAWTRGDLVFDKTPVPQMLRELSRWYGYEFKLADSVLATQHVSVMFAVDKPDETMRTLATLLNVVAEREGNVITLKPRGTRNRGRDSLGNVRNRAPFNSPRSEVGK